MKTYISIKNILWLVCGLLAPCLGASTGYGQSTFNLSVTEDPVVTGSGVGQTARYRNVGSMQGKSVDLIGRIESTTSNLPNVFLRQGNDFRFEMMEAPAGHSRTVAVRWSFVESDTDNLVPLDTLNLTIDDLDGGPSSRQEALSTGDAYGHVIDFPSNVQVIEDLPVISASGSAEQATGEPDSAITLYFSGKDSILITYHASFSTDYSSNTAAFIHDGNGEFNYTNPTDPPKAPKKLYYTYHFHNPTGSFMRMDFENTLPSGLKWDRNYDAILKKKGASGLLDTVLMTLHLSWLAEIGESNSALSYDSERGVILVDTSFSNGNQTVEIKDLDLPSGEYEITLKTKEVGKGGRINNTASLNRKNDNKKYVANASIDVAD